MLLAVTVTWGDVVPSADHVMVRVKDVDVHMARARMVGATIVADPVDFPYGECRAAAADPSGRSWVFSQTVRDVDPAERGATPG